MSTPLTPRALAVQLLYCVIVEGRSFHPSMAQPFKKALTPQDSAFAVYLCFGVLRYYFYLQKRLSLLLQKPLKSKDRDIEILILLGLYQLYFTDMPAYAAINSTVEATPSSKKAWAKNLINALLRRAQREGHGDFSLSEIPALTHPDWLRKMIQDAWPHHANALFEASLQHPPFVLRVNAQKTSLEGYLKILEKQNIEANPLAPLPHAFEIVKPIDVDKLPAFNEGAVSVQDAGAQLTPTIIPLSPGYRILDACAAPGGKMAHLLEQEPRIDLVAIESCPKRYQRLEETVRRLSLDAKLHCSDATDLSWWDGSLFDCVLIDAPCSATGILRRHPDIKLHRRHEDINTLVSIQSQLLNSLWPLVKQGGILVYVTCSILPSENIAQMNHFLRIHADAQEWPIEADWGHAQPIGRQLLPGEANRDGFYYARLRKLG